MSEQNSLPRNLYREILEDAEGWKLSLFELAILDYLAAHRDYANYSEQTEVSDSAIEAQLIENIETAGDIVEQMLASTDKERLSKIIMSLLLLLGSARDNDSNFIVDLLQEDMYGTGLSGLVSE